MTSRILVRLHKNGTDHAPRLAAFTECVVDYFGGDGLANVYTLLEQNSLIISNSYLPQSCLLHLKHPSFCPIKDLNLHSLNLKDETLLRGIDTGVAVLLESSDGKILLTKRAAHLHAFPNVWVPPGGHLEMDETLTQAGLRELHEETGLSITEAHCEGSQLNPLALWESVYPPRLSLGMPTRHHIVLYLHAKLTETHTAESLFDKLSFDPNEVASCVWVDHTLIRAIVHQTEEDGDHVQTDPTLPKTVRALVIDKDKKQSAADISVEPLLQSTRHGQNCERVSTGTKYALEQFLLKMSK